MNGERIVSTFDEDRLFDLLVDGELDEARRRELLAKLDHTPGGWRSCALAFLEAQSWRQECGAIAAANRAVPSGVLVDRPTKPTNNVWRSALAIAASFAIAFGLGAWYRGGQTRKDDLGTDTTFAKHGGPTPQVAATEDLALRQLIDQDGYMTLALGGVADGELKQVRVPVQQEGFDAAQLERPVELPRDLLAELQRNGQTVRQQRSYLPVPLQDGRSIIVPMDELQIVPVNRVFQ